MEADPKRLLKFFEQQPGCKWEHKHGRTWILRRNDQVVLVVKKITNPTTAIMLPFENVQFMTGNLRFRHQKDTMELILVRGASRKSTPQECLDTGVSIYKNLDNIMVIGQKIKMPKDILTLGHVLTPHYPPQSSELAKPLFARLLSAFRGIEKCPRGFFHGDLHCPNVLVDGDQKFVIDFDDISHSPGILNIAQPYYIENLKKHLLSVEGYDWEKVLSFTNGFIDKLLPQDRENFWSFVRLCGYYWETRTIPMRVKGTEERHVELQKWLALIDDVTKRLTSAYKN